MGMEEIKKKKKKKKKIGGKKGKEVKRFLQKSSEVAGNMLRKNQSSLNLTIITSRLKSNSIPFRW